MEWRIVLRRHAGLRGGLTAALEAARAWRDVWLGAAVTAALRRGKVLIGIYLGKSAVASSFGAAGTLVAVVVWVYWCAQVFFLGAEITKVNAQRRAK